MRIPRGTAWGWPALILAVALAVRWATFGGVRVVDHIEMARYAHQIVDGTYEPIALRFPLRIAFIGPMALFQAVLGLGDLACSLFTLLCSLASVLLAYVVASRWGGRLAGIVAGLTLAVLPLDVIHSTQPWVDGPAALFSAVAGFMVLEAHLKDRSGSWRLLAVGLLAGAAYLAKETGAFVMVLPVVLALMRRQARWAILPVLGFGLVVAAEMAVWGVWTGDFLLRFRAANDILDCWSLYYPTRASVVFRLTVEFPLMMSVPVSPDFVYFGFFFWLFGAGAAAYARSLPPLRWLAAWVLIVLAVILWFPASLWPYKPALLALARHLYPLVIPAAVGVGLAFARAKRRRLAVAFLGLQLLASAAGAGWVHLYQQQWTEGVREAFEAARSAGADRIYGDKIGVGLYEYWLGFPEDPRLSRHEYLEPHEFAPGVLIDNPQWIEAGGIGPKWRGREPSDWTVLWERTVHRRPSPGQILRGTDPGSFQLRVLRVGGSGG